MSLQLHRLRSADRLVAGGAAALLVFMFFFDWFGESGDGTLPGDKITGVNSSSTGWDTFTHSRWIWLLTIVVALASAVAIAGAKLPQTSLQPGAIVALLGALSALLIVYRIVHHPIARASFGGFHASYATRLGIWLGLLAALAIACGGYLQARAQGTHLTGAREQTDAPFRGLTVPGDAAPAPAESRPPSPPEHGSPSGPAAAAPSPRARQDEPPPPAQSPG